MRQIYGIDLSKDKFDVNFLSANNKARSFIVKNNLNGIIAFTWFGRDTAIRVGSVVMSMVAQVTWTVTGLFIFCCLVDPMTWHSLICFFLPCMVLFHFFFRVYDRTFAGSSSWFNWVKYPLVSSTTCFSVILSIEVLALIRAESTA
jgi:hypothetical protein